VSSALWEEQWRKHLAGREAPAEAIDEFWKTFIDEIVEVVTKDGVVDLRKPEEIEAWVGPPYVELKLDREKFRVLSRFWTQNKDLSETRLFDKVLVIDDGKADLREFGSPGLKAAVECGSAVGKFLFSLRNLKEE